MRDTCLVPPTLRDIFSLTTNYDVSHYPILSTHLLSLSRSQSISFRMSRQRSNTFGLQDYTETSMLVPIYQTVPRYIPEQKFILTVVGTSYIIKETHFMTTIILCSTELRLSHSVYSSNK